MNDNIPLPQPYLRPLNQPLYDCIRVKHGLRRLNFFQEFEEKNFSKTNMQDKGRLKEPFSFSFFSLGFRALKPTRELPKLFLSNASIEFYLNSKTLLKFPFIHLTSPESWPELQDVIRKYKEEELKKSGTSNGEIARILEADNRFALDPRCGDVLTTVGTNAIRIRSGESFGVAVDLNGYTPITDEEFDLWCILGGVLWSPL